MPSGAVLLLSLRRLTMTGPELCSRFIAVFEDCRRRLANLEALFESLLIKPADLLVANASLIALWLDLRDTRDSGNSKDVGRDSPSRPLGPSGEGCMELFEVASWCGDITGDCGKLEATDEELTAEVGMDTEELIVGSEVWSFVVCLTRCASKGSCNCDCTAMVDCGVERRSGDGGEDLGVAEFDIL